MLFRPFGIPILGRTMVILGGSLTEVAFPLLFVGYFLRKREDGRRRDVFAAMVYIACLRARDPSGIIIELAEQIA